MTQQTVVAEPDELRQEVKMAENSKYENITMGIQISPKREKLLNPQNVKLAEIMPELYGEPI